MLQTKYMVIERELLDNELFYQIVAGPFDRLIEAENWMDKTHHDQCEVIQTWSK